MAYKENPKTKGSGIVCCIPQAGRCPVGCEDCFFQSGRSYLEPLESNLPNMPEVVQRWQVVRVNDGNDSNVNRDKVVAATTGIERKFFNTSIPHDIGGLPGPVVLTANPGGLTDRGMHKLPDPLPINLMFIRVRSNTWNTLVIEEAVGYYSEREVPIVLTWMAYFGTADTIPPEHRPNYIFRQRTTNSYWAITTEAWEQAMAPYRRNKWVYSCGKIEGELGTTACRHCGNCLREYAATMERLLSRESE